MEKLLIILLAVTLFSCEKQEKTTKTTLEENAGRYQMNKGKSVFSFNGDVYNYLDSLNATTLKIYVGERYLTTSTFLDVNGTCNWQSGQTILYHAWDINQTNSDVIEISLKTTSGELVTWASYYLNPNACVIHNFTIDQVLI